MRPDVPPLGRNDSYALRSEARQGTVRLTVVEVVVMMVMVVVMMVIVSGSEGTAVMTEVVVTEDDRLVWVERFLD
jgi:hypothetical protein